MGVVRKDGDWRLEKRSEGVYEVTHQGRAELKIITADYQQGGLTDERMDFALPVREVESFSQAESLFDGMAQRGAAHADEFSSSPRTADSELGFGNDDLNLDDVPPIGLFAGGLLISIIFVSQSGFNLGSTVFQIGAMFLVLPLGVGGLTYLKYSNEGTDEALDFFLSGGDSDRSKESGDETVRNDKPVPEKVKNRLFFERAKRRCEYCDKEIDSHDTHHIKPRNEGGSNDEMNLIILCPNCHRKADRGAISRSKLRHKVREHSKRNSA